MTNPSNTPGTPTRSILKSATRQSIEDSSESIWEDIPEGDPPPTHPLTLPDRVFNAKGRAVDPDIGIPTLADPEKSENRKFTPGTTYIRRKVSFPPEITTEDSGLGRRQLVLPILPPSSNNDDGAPEQRTKVRLILQGAGGVFAFGVTAADMCSRPELRREAVHALRPGESIGTKFCGTGVGVYFEIRGKLCFCAHIEVENGRSDSACNDARKSERDKVANAVRNKLQDLSMSQGWRREDVRLDTLTIVGRLIFDERIQTAVSDGVREFFGPWWLGAGVVRTYKHGFVVVPGLRKSFRFLDIVKVGGDDVYKVPDEFEFVVDEGLEALGWRYSCAGGWKKARFGVLGLDGPVGEEQVEEEVVRCLIDECDLS